MLVPFKIQSPNCRVDRKTHCYFYGSWLLSLWATPVVRNSLCWIHIHPAETSFLWAVETALFFYLLVIPSCWVLFHLSFDVGFYGVFALLVISVRHVALVVQCLGGDPGSNTEFLVWSGQHGAAWPPSFTPVLPSPSLWLNSVVYCTQHCLSNGTALEGKIFPSFFSIFVILPLCGMLNFHGVLWRLKMS